MSDTDIVIEALPVAPSVRRTGVPVAAGLCLAGAMTIVGSSAVAGRLLVERLPIHFGSLVRFVLATGLCWVLVRLLEGPMPRLSRRSLGILALQAFLGSFLFTVLFLEGLRWTTPAAAGVITGATPACMGLLAWVFLRQRGTWRTAGAIALAAGGIALVQAASGGGEGPVVAARPLWGGLCVLGAVAAESCFLLLRVSIRERLSPLAASFYVSLFGLTFFLPLGLVEAASVDFAAVDATAWWAVAYYGAVVTVAAYVLWFAGIMRVPAQAASIFPGIMPVAATLLSALVLGEHVGPAHLAGMAAVCAAVLLAARERQ